MKRTWRFFFVVLVAGLILSGWLWVFNPSLASANIRYVSTDGNCNGQSPCYQIIQAAVDAAVTGDELRVAAGTYTGVSTRNTNTQHVYLDKTLNIQGGYHPATWTLDPEMNATFLDAQDQGRVFYITGDISPLIDGFHITNGKGDFGGGVYVLNASPTISHNQIFRNHAVGWGGGILLDGSSAIIQSNHIYNNTTGEAGRGGGLRLTNSPATIQDNVIEGNISHVGGGIDLENYLDNTGAMVIGNSLLDNHALDWVDGATTFGGVGGGINTKSYALDTIQSNNINGNTAKWGGGVHAFGASVAILDNLIQQNNAPVNGGGLYVQGGEQVTIQRNQISLNHADYWGGGLYHYANTGLIANNTFRENSSGARGGGLYANSGAQYDGNLFLDNESLEGGGAFLLYASNAVYQNSVFLGNQATAGGAIYMWDSNVSFDHSTISNNPSSDGNAVVINKYDTPTNVTFSNTIVNQQGVGFDVVAADSVFLDGILSYQVGNLYQSYGASVTVLNELEGSPLFQADGYHLHANSPARDVASSTLNHDIDGHLREAGDYKDLGADEYVPVILVEPDTGGELTYISDQENVTITVDIPPDAFDIAVGLMFSPFPPLPPDVMNSPFGSFVAVGPPFGLDVYEIDETIPDPDPQDPPLGDETEEFILGVPAHIVMEYGIEHVLAMKEAMAQLELALLSIINNTPTFEDMMAAECGEVEHDLDGQTIDVPICDTGIIPDAPEGSTAPQLRLLAVNPGTKSGFFIFVIEVENKIFLPLILN